MVNDLISNKSGSSAKAKTESIMAAMMTRQSPSLWGLFIMEEPADPNGMDSGRPRSRAVDRGLQDPGQGRSIPVAASDPPRLSACRTGCLGGRQYPGQTSPT